MTTPRVPSAEDLGNDIVDCISCVEAAQILQAYARAVLEAAAEVATRSGLMPSPEAQVIAAEIRALKEDL